MGLQGHWNLEINGAKWELSVAVCCFDLKEGRNLSRGLEMGSGEPSSQQANE